LRRQLIFLHRWLGIAGNLLFVVWFGSALVMMYARMPALDPGDRLNRLPALDVEAVRVGPEQAAVAARLQGGTAEAHQIRLGMAGERPIYRFRTAAGWTSVWADTGSPMLQLSESEATDVATRFVRHEPTAEQRAAEPTWDGLLNRPDQWTLQLASLLPLHRIRTGSDVLYVSDRTAEVVLETTPSSRFWGMSGAVFHWFYFTPLRSHSALWYQVVVWTSFGGCVLALSGLAVGLLRLRPRRRRKSPYSGSMRWHHYTGLAFGFAAFTFALSGALSMDPFGWQSGGSPRAAERLALRGEATEAGGLDLEAVRPALQRAEAAFAIREVEFLQFAGEPLLLAYRPPVEAGTGESSRAMRPSGGAPTSSRPVRGPGRGYRASTSYQASPAAFLGASQRFDSLLLRIEDATVRQFSRQELLVQAARALPEAAVVEATLLNRYDAYYGDRRSRATPLPVLRAKFDDPARTWLYLDGARGLVARRNPRGSWRRGR